MRVTIRKTVLVQVTSIHAWKWDGAVCKFWLSPLRIGEQYPIGSVKVLTVSAVFFGQPSALFYYLDSLLPAYLLYVHRTSSSYESPKWTSDYGPGLTLPLPCFVRPKQVATGSQLYILVWDLLCLIPSDWHHSDRLSPQISQRWIYSLI